MRPTLQEILDATLNVLNISKDIYDKTRNSRLANVVRVRQIFCYVGEHYGYTLHAMGNFLHLTHSTVYHNKEMAKDFCSYEKGYANKINEILSHFEKVQKIYVAKGTVQRGQNGSISFLGDDANGIKAFLPSECFPQVAEGDPPFPCEVTFRIK